MRARSLLAGLLALSLTVAWLVAVGTAPAQAQVTSRANPAIPDRCGLDITLVLDASGSIGNDNGNVRKAAQAFVETLADTNSRARITQFASRSAELAPSTEITRAAVQPGGALTKAINGYYPGPAVPSGVEFHKYLGGNRDLLDPDSFKRTTETVWTNWDDALADAGKSAGSGSLVVFITDGRPTAFDLSESADPFDQGPPPDVAIANDGNPQGAFATQALDRAVFEANSIKQAGARILTVGVGTALNNTPDQNRLVAVSGSKVVRDADLGSVNTVNDIDVALVRNFGDLTRALRTILLQLCSPSLTITKLAQSADDATYRPAGGWTTRVTPSVPGGFRWVLPDASVAPTKSVVTGANGTAQFQWEPTLPNARSAATVQEALQPGFTAGRGGAPDYECELRSADGTSRRIPPGELTGGDQPSFTLPDIGQEIVTCTLYNSFNYNPSLTVTKTNDPPIVRGDLRTPVTSTYQVSNTGNTPLTIDAQDNLCAPLVRTAGDGNGNNKLDPTETWTYTCVRQIAGSVTPDPQVIQNTVTVTGTPPTGEPIPPVPATATVTVYRPGIKVEKTVNGQTGGITVQSGTEVTYGYTVRNSGNLPLAVGIADVSNPDTGCASPTGPTGDTNGNGILEPSEEWQYTCTATVTGPTDNTVTVTGTPRNPGNPAQPFPGPNPPVTAKDIVTVNTISPGLEFTKEANRTVVFAGTAVTYTYTADNTGDVPLRNPNGQDDRSLVTDDKCSPVQYQDGDTNGDFAIDPDETWTYTCTATLSATTTNVATITAQPPVGPSLPPLTSKTTVEVVSGGIDVTKRSLRPLVLDPAAQPETGPDAGTPRAALYEYEVTNTGEVPVVLDQRSDDTCSPLVFEGGDTNNDDRLDVDEVWRYTCETELTVAQINAPPLAPGESGTVQNTVTVTGVPFVPEVPEPERPTLSTTDTARTQVIKPGLVLRKAASPQAALAGSAVTYTFEVENTGDVALQVLGPEDDRCAPLVFQNGDGNGNGLLDGSNSGTAETWTYACTRTVGLPEPPETEVENNAIVRGVDPPGNVYPGQATDKVRVFNPGIDLVKTVDRSLVLAGTEVTYSFDVTNAGTSPLEADDVLAQVQLADASDPAQPSCTSPQFLRGDDNGNNLLDRAPAETWRYTCSASIDKPTTNVAVVGGIGGTTFTPPIPVPVFAFDTAFVQPFRPGIQVVKTAEPSRLLGAGEVTYSYRVRNTGDVPLANVRERIADDTCSPVTLASGDEDQDGLLDTTTSIFEDAADETWVFTCTTTVSDTTTNTVTVPGTPTNPTGTPLCEPGAPCDVTGTSTRTVTVTKPGTIVIEKATEPASGQAFSFTIAGVPFTLSGGQSKTYQNLEPGQYTVTEALPEGWTLDKVECADPTGDTTTAKDRAVIELAEDEVVRCVFTNKFVPTAQTPQPLPPTGASGLAPLLAAAAGLVTLGALLVRSARLRSRQSPPA